MTFPIGRDLIRGAVVAALVGSAWSCSNRAPEPSAGAAAVAATRAADSSAATDTTHSAPATPTASPDSAPAAVPDSAPVPDSASAPAAGAVAAADSQYLKYDPATKTVTFSLVAGPFSFNGFTSGGGTLTVPPGTKNTWNFLQNDGTPHSAEVGAGAGPLPSSGGDPAIPRAYTNKVIEGLVQGATDVISFTAPDTGTYRIICGVPGHALSGMWIWFKIDPSAKVPSFGATQK